MGYPPAGGIAFLFLASSQLEGAATSRKVAKEMLENNRKPQNHSAQMILNRQFIPTKDYLKKLGIKK